MKQDLDDVLYINKIPLLRAGVHHVSTFDVPTRAETVVLANDVSWGSSPASYLLVGTRLPPTRRGTK